jgi:hypothetical protein
MDFFDIIKELRKGDPDVKKAGKAMKILGWLCIVGALWNYAFYYLAPFDETPFTLPASYPYLALISFLFLGGLFLYSSQAIKRMQPMGKRAGQLAIFVLVALLIGFMFFMFPKEALPLESDLFSIIFLVFLGIFFAQFGVPAYFGIRYLERLPTHQDTIEGRRFTPENITKVVDEKQSLDTSIPQTKYKDALFPFGILGTFALLIAIPLISFFAIERFGDPKQMAFMFMPTFLFIFFAPVAYNFLPSPFQKQRNTIASFTGGGSIFLFNGTWPFFRLLVYHDGLEIRIMFHRFFIPYDKMEDIPEKVGFFNRGILIKSNLPEVPSGIRYQGFGMKRIVAVVTQNRKRSVLGNIKLT